MAIEKVDVTLMTPEDAGSGANDGFYGRKNGVFRLLRWGVLFASIQYSSLQNRPTLGSFAERNFPGGGSRFLRDDGEWATISLPSGGGTPTAVEWSSINGPISASPALVTAFGLKADRDNAQLTGVPIAPTAAASTSNTQIATTAHAHAAALLLLSDTTSGNSAKTWSQVVIANRVAAAAAAVKAEILAGVGPAFDTLLEFQLAVGGDANYAATTAAALGKRVRFDAAQSLSPTEIATVQANLGLTILLQRLLPTGGLIGQIPERTASGYQWVDKPVSSGGGTTPTPEVDPLEATAIATALNVADYIEARSLAL